MMVKNDLVQVRVSHEVKEQAEAIFEQMGLKMGDAIRVFLQQCIHRNGLPFVPLAKTPNKKTLEAIKEIEEGKSQRFESVRALMDDLNAED